MKIAQIICTFPPYKGGMGNVAYEQAKGLARLGHKVAVFTPQYSNLENKGENFDFKIVYLNSYIKYGNAAFLPQLLFKLKKFDVVHLHYPFFGATEIIWLAKKLGLIKKIVIFYHMDFIPKNIFLKIFSLPNRVILKSLLNSTDKIIVSTLDYISQLSIKEYFNKHKEKFIAIPFGSRFSQVDPVEPKEKVVKKILFVGALDKAHYFKGVDILLKSFKKVLSKVNNVRLMIVGEGDLKKEYIQQAQDLNISDKVDFVGRSSEQELKEIYTDCDIFVLPSINSGEAFGLVLIEAMSFSKPVIASNLPGVRTVCRDNANGFLVEPGNKNDLTDKILKLVQDNNLANKMGKKGREMVENEYTWLIHVKKLEKVYEDIYHNTNL